MLDSLQNWLFKPTVTVNRVNSNVTYLTWQLRLQLKLKRAQARQVQALEGNRVHNIKHNAK